MIGQWSLGPVLHSNMSVIPRYTFTFKFEENFDTDTLNQLTGKYFNVCLFPVTVYLPLLHLGTILMKNRPAYVLRKTLILWNIMLAVFSVVGAHRSITELHHTATNFGFKASYCSFHSYRVNPVAAAWYCFFGLSKIVELLDTAFVVLRKQKLTFLHWFHHSTVLVFTWFSGHDNVAMSRWFTTMNYSVHSFMYSYYALRAAKFPIPRNIAMVITVTQVMQMIVGLYISVIGFWAWLSGDVCDITGRMAISSIGIYSFYFVLFMNFFYKAYIYSSLKRVHDKYK